MKNYFIVLLLFFAGFNFVAKAQNISNEGMEFWTVFPTHRPNGNNLADMNINVTSRYDTEVTVSCGNTTETKVVPANTVVTFLVSRPQSYIDELDGNKNLINRAIHIKVTPGKPKIVAYSHVFASARSAATLILPVDALGQKYYSMNYTQDNQGQNFLALIASEDNTDLVLHKKDGTTLDIKGLNKGDVYEYLVSSQDLTGTYVETAANSSCKKFAAFSGSSGLRIGGATGGVDPLLQQLYSVDSWGKTYGVVPFISRRYIVRVLAQENNTIVNIDGAVAGTINKGEFIERTLSSPTIVSSDKLISVAEYSFTQEFSSPSGGSLTGDPEMVLLNPIEFNIKNITLFSSSKYRIDERYLNVFMKTDKASTFKINGVLPTNGVWSIMPSNPLYSYIQIAVTESTLTLTADDGFNAMAYGFGDHESYAYSAGTNLASTQFLLFVNKTSSIESAVACVNQPADFKLTLPYQLEKIVWKFNDGTADYEDNSPVGIASGTSTILYTYSAPVNKIFSTVGSAQVIANATLSAAAGSCFTKEVELIFNFTVDPLPEAKISAPLKSCSGVDVQFMDESNAKVAGKNITAWHWDFGDGSFSNEKNPKHAFKDKGSYKVRLYVTAENGCSSDVVETEILVNETAKAAFSAAAIKCAGSDIAFTDHSTLTEGNIVKWTWDFNDPSSTSNISNLQSPVHQFNTAGSYLVKLTIETDKGCTDVSENLIVVNALPKVDFVTPDICLADAQAVFFNKSTDFDGTSTVGLTYLWDFGDPTSGVLNTSTVKDGTHKYNAAGNYNVTLTIKNANDCSTTITKPFVVNGSFPKADFGFENNICSNKPITLINKSTVDFGNITKVKWFFDEVKQGEDEEPTPNKAYTFNYTPFTSPLVKTINVKMVVYSGGICTNEITKQLTLLAAPAVNFNSLTSICLNAGSVQLTARETGNVPGSGTFNGKGVTPTGLFNPIVAGVGLHDITYTFTSNAGCTDQVTRSIEVYALPLIDAGAETYILVGGEKKLEATASGDIFSYKWTPSTGLNKDDILNPVASPLNDVRYTLTVTSSKGCVVTSQVFVHVLQNIEAPNSFTPNGDGVNDVWNIKYLDTYPNASVEIFNRNGDRIYYSKGYTKPFDGNFNNNPLPVGTYYYIISPNSGRKSITGALTIIR